MRTNQIRMSEADGAIVKSQGARYEIIGRVGDTHYHCKDLRTGRERTFGVDDLLRIADADVADMIRSDRVRDEHLFADLETFEDEGERDEDGAWELEEQEEYTSLEALFA